MAPQSVTSKADYESIQISRLPNRLSRADFIAGRRKDNFIVYVSDGRTKKDQSKYAAANMEALLAGGYLQRQIDERDLAPTPSLHHSRRFGLS